MTNPEKIKQILLSEIEKMGQHREDFCKHPGSADQYRHICKEAAFDYLPAEGYRRYEVSLRFPIGNGSYENIITNLPENKFSAEEIKEIYHLR